MSRFDLSGGDDRTTGLVISPWSQHGKAPHEVFDHVQLCDEGIQARAGTKATAASLVSSKNVKVSWRYSRTALSVWLE